MGYVSRWNLAATTLDSINGAHPYRNEDNMNTVEALIGKGNWTAPDYTVDPDSNPNKMHIFGATEVIPPLNFASTKARPAAYKAQLAQTKVFAARTWTLDRMTCHKKQAMFSKYTVEKKGNMVVCKWGKCVDCDGTKKRCEGEGAETITEDEIYTMQQGRHIEWREAQAICFRIIGPYMFPRDVSDWTAPHTAPILPENPSPVEWFTQIPEAHLSPSLITAFTQSAETHERLQKLQALSDKRALQREQARATTPAPDPQASSDKQASTRALASSTDSTFGLAAVPALKKAKTSASANPNFKRYKRNERSEAM